MKFIGFFLIFFVGYTIVVSASFDETKFKYLTVDEGLSNNRIHCVLRDSKDFIWIGTNNGLNRWDGSTITIFSVISDDTTSISANAVMVIFEDNESRMWFGTNKGISLFDRKTEKFQRLYHDPLDLNTIPINNITGIVQDCYGEIWISTSNGFCKYNKTTNNFTRYKLPHSKLNTTANYITNITYDKTNTLWFGTLSEYIWSFDITTQTFKKYSHPNLSSTINMRKHIALDGDRIWIGTVGNGLFCFEPKENKCIQFPISEATKGTNGQNIENLLISDDNYLYISLDHGGISRLDLKNRTFEHCVNSELNNHGLNSPGVWTIYFDIEGIMYVGTSNRGLNIHNPKENLFEKFENNKLNNNSLPFDIVYRLYEDSQGLIWIGTDGGGLSIFNPKNRSFKNFAHDPNDPNSISGNAVLSIGEDKSHNMWIGTWGEGLNKFDRKTEKFIRYYSNPDDPSTISSNNIYDLIFDKDGQLWLCYILEEGVDVFDINKGVIKRYRQKPNDSSSIATNEVQALRILGDDIGILTHNGFYTLKPGTETLHEWKTVKEIYLNDAFLDSKGNYWLCSSEDGLISIDSKGIVQHYGKKDGFYTNIISSILEDNTGNLWITSNGGLSKYDPQINKFTHHLLPRKSNNKQFAIISSLRASDGTFYLGGYNGFYTFNPDELRFDISVPKVVINDFQIFNKTIQPNSPDSILKYPILETSEIKISYRENVISFGFTALNYTYTRKVKFKYMLEGYDNDWTETSSIRKFASYTNLDPGTYTFKVKASNSDNVWNETPATLKLIITPPFWKRWWFRLLVIFTIVSALLSYYLNRVSKLKKQQYILEETVAERTSELMKVNKDLEQSKEEIMHHNEAIMIKNEELESSQEEILKKNTELEYSNQTKDKLYSIIAHDLQNPFNSIIGFINILSDDFEELSDTKKKKIIEIIKNSSETTNELIGNLLEWVRTQTNRLNITLKKASVIDIVENNLQLMKTTADIKNITFSVKYIKHDLYIFADVNMINTVIRNILTNAIKFSPPHSTITIQAKQNTKNEFIDISIIDQGVGMDKEKLDHLFSVEFTQSTKGTSGEKGTGLGLLICNEFVESNNGTIKVKSDLSKGTEFIISLPVG